MLLQDDDSFLSGSDVLAVRRRHRLRLGQGLVELDFLPLQVKDPVLVLRSDFNEEGRIVLHTSKPDQRSYFVKVKGRSLSRLVIEFQGLSRKHELLIEVAADVSIE